MVKVIWEIPNVLRREVESALRNRPQSGYFWIKSSEHEFMGAVEREFGVTITEIFKAFPYDRAYYRRVELGQNTAAVFKGFN